MVRESVLMVSHAISCAACWQTLSPKVHIHKLDGEFSEVAVLQGVAELEVTAMAFSANGKELVTVASEPDLRLQVWEWHKVRQCLRLLYSFTMPSIEEAVNYSEAIVEHAGVPPSSKHGRPQGCQRQLSSILQHTPVHKRRW